ncbi:MAG: 3-deoxy-7-phosphoheptulonate synthase [Candidatus Diapherotrites archaeon]|nr:3-deoxy-7-phosphoheptulonate synthase [Candidatus Diapherotrites archaeon]
MIIIASAKISEKDLNGILAYIKSQGFKCDVSKGTEKIIIGVLGDERTLSKEKLEFLPGVEKVMQVLKPFKMASREFHPENTVIEFDNGATIGNKEVLPIPGPCAIESEEQLFGTAEALKKLGIKVIRASAFKPRTSPYAFQGIGVKGLKWLKKVKDELDLVTETEVMDIRDVEVSAKYADILRVGTRNMQNFDLLKEVGKLNKPVIIKRGFAATIEEWLLSAEYVLANGNRQVILCERGIRTFEQAYRNTLDLTAVPYIKKASHLPIIVDPSHGTGTKSLVPAMSKAAIACGADGILVDVHWKPEEALVDAKQALTPAEFGKLLEELRPVAKAIGREIK